MVWLCQMPAVCVVLYMCSNADHPKRSCKGIVDEVLHCGVFCRVLRPPGGGSSNLFGGFEDDAAASRKPHKMASNIFGTPEQPESSPKRSNPPGQNSDIRL